MARTVAGILAWMAVLASIAGCVGPDSDPDGPIIVTDPDDYSYLENNTAGTQHIHDYWGGQQVLPVIDVEERRVMRLQSDGSGYIPELFRPEAGSIVPLGAAEVHITIRWDEDPANQNFRPGDEPLRLRVKTAADARGLPFAELENGQTLVFETSNEQNDIPHQRLSAWQFIVDVPAPIPAGTSSSGTSYDMDFDILIEARRGHDIPPFPAHPDLWDAADSLKVADGFYPRYVWHNTGALDGGSEGGSNRPANIPLDAGQVIPHDADHIIVEVWNGQSDAHEEPTENLHLLYQDSTTWEFQSAEQVAEDTAEQTRTYRIEIDNNADSPYALQSVWHFTFAVDGDPDVPRVSIGDLELVATVYKEAET